MRLWGEKPWVLRQKGRDRGCWEEWEGGQFFVDALTGTACDRNWMEVGYAEPRTRLDRELRLLFAMGLGAVRPYSKALPRMND